MILKGRQVAAKKIPEPRGGIATLKVKKLINSIIYPDSLKTREKFLVFFGLADSAPRMIRGGFLTEEDRGKLVALARDGSAASRLTRRANALVLLDGGWSCREVAAALLTDDDTIRGWHKLFEQRGIEGLTSFDMGGSAGFLSTAQEDALRAFVGATLPRSTRQVGAWIEQEFGLVYENRSGLIALRPIRRCDAQLPA
jgi:transposase